MICSSTVGGPKASRRALATLLLAASAACTSSSNADRDTAAPNTVRTEPAPTTTTNPYAVPAVIDEAYVNRVLAGLDQVMGDVVRLVISTRTIPREAYDRLRALYGTDQWLQLALDNFQADMRNGFTGYKRQPGDKVSVVRRILTGDDRCIFAEVDRDFSAVSPTPNPVNPQWVGLRPLESTRDPNGYNTTGWAYIYDGFPPSRLQPPNPCAG